MNEISKKLCMWIALLFTYFYASAYDFEVGGIYYKINSDPYNGKGTVWVSYNPAKLYSGDISIPNIVQKGGYSYKVIGTCANSFKDCVNLSSINFLFDDDIEIGANSFSGCSHLQEVHLPANLTGIPMGAFKNCSSLNYIELPTTIRIIETEAFANCTGLKSFLVPESIQILGLKAFDNCNSLLNVFFLSMKKPYCEGDSEQQVFSNCSATISLWVPDKNIYQFGKEYVSFERTQFQYSGNTPTINIKNNLNTYQYSINCPNLEKDFGQYETYVKIDYTGDRQFNVHIPYTYSISKAPLIVSVDNVERQYGEENPVFPVKYDGFKNSENSSVLWQLPEMSTEATITSPVGSYSINIKGGSARNYEITTYYSGNLTITKAPLTLTANNVERPYYTENPKFSYTLSGLLNDDDTSCLNKTPSFVCSANIDSDCGEYQIIPLNADAKNYNITYKEGTLTIKPEHLTLVAKNLSREYGEENPALEFEAQGLKGNDTPKDALQGQPTLTATCNPTSKVGKYPITITGGKARNYTLSYLSGSLTVTKAPITITVLDANRQYGASNPKFEFSVDGLKLDDTKVSVFSQMPDLTTAATEKTDVGNYLISVSGGAAKNYEIIEYRPGNLTITKAPLTLTANNVERLYYTENPDFSYSLTGLLNGDNNSCISKDPIFACSASIHSPCGDYSIVPSQAEARNYNITYIEGSLKIKPENLILVATSISREYGDPNPRFRYEAIGLKGEDQLITSLNNEPILTTTATENSNVGEYPITISGASSKNYDISYRQGVLIVDKAPLTVIADDAERVYGDNNPSFSRSYLGFKLNDTETTAFSTLPRLTCTATRTSDVGDYPITVEGGTSRNYEVSIYKNGILSVTKSPLILTANDKSRLYYESNPQFDFILSGLKNNDTKACVTTLPTYTCTAETTSNAGQYQIIPNNAEAKNYTFEYRNGILSVTPRPLTASVGNYTRKYNTENPSFEVRYTGFVNDEDSSVMLSQAMISCDATKTSDVGSYTLTPTGGEATNYNVTKYINGTLTIEKADQTLSWNQDLSNIELYSQIALKAESDAGLPVSYEMSPNNVANLYHNAGIWYLDCYGSGAVSIRAVQKGTSNYNAASIIIKTLVVNGSGEDPSNTQIYLHIETAGTLSAMIAENRKYQIKNLRLTGYLNGTDINYLREMAGGDCYGNTTTGILEVLDISGCSIVSGGRSYYRSYQTSNNKVGDYMFYNCKVLVNLKLPDNVTSLGSYALADCDRLSNLSMPNSITSFGSNAFQNDISLLRIPMPNSLSTIGDMAFYGCNGLTEIIITKNVSTLGDGILKACENIAKINVEDDNRYFASLDGVLYASDFNELLIFPVCHGSNSYSIIDGVNKIAPYAFANSKKLSEVTMPSSLRTIGKDAFIGCANLTSLRVKALNPPVCENDCFDAISKARCELLVPNGCYSYYWVAPVWSGFNKISESDFLTGIDKVLNNAIEVIVENRNIVIKGAPAGVQVLIYKIDGTLADTTISNGSDIVYRPSFNGVYIVASSEQTYKVLIR